MNTNEYLELMQFPKEWEEYGLIPSEEFIKNHILSLKPGEEHSSKHYRHDAFHYWLNQQPPTGILEKLTNLTFVDPDEEMAKSIRAEILKQPNCSEELHEMIIESQ